MTKEVKIRCPNCGYEGKPAPGRSGILEVLLFIFTLQFFLIPFFYTNTSLRDGNVLNVVLEI